MNDTVDAIIVGAGPAGLAAAAELAKHRLSVCLLDEQIGPGGQIWRNTNPVHQWPGVIYSPASTVIDICAQETISVTWLQHSPTEKVMRQTHARALIIATGAMERPLLFPGVQLPGVMGIGAMQCVLKQARLVPRGPGVVLAGHGPLLLLTAKQIMEQGASIDAVLDLSIPGARKNAAKCLPGAVIADPSLLIQGIQLIRSLRRMGIRVWKNVTALEASGDGLIKQVQFVADSCQQRLPARLLAVHDGVLANTQLTRLLNLEHYWNEAQQSFVPLTHANGQSSHPQVWIAGDGAGVVGVDLAVQRGRLAGLAVAQALKPSPTHKAKQSNSVKMKLLERGIRRRLPARLFIDTLYPPLPIDHLATADTIVCRCEAITLGTIRSAIAQGAVGPNRVKTFTRCGMGACQGRQCSTQLTRIVAQETGKPAGVVGALRIRPPLKPTLIADYLSLALTNTPDVGTNA
ncbi:MAG: NADPH-dependent 2,4-dienoyl-CoA reductase/sulfur reductase-like enzyme [Granulosicoccus sp.]|jgi:NADPH-dependent 2,4-dienoyl-CoA reductase/sulfur reductase-like enzyme